MRVDREALKKMGEVGLKRAYDDHMAAVNAPKRVPFAGLDRAGSPPREDLARFERRGWLGVVPRRSAWPELEQLDQRVAELQRRHGEAQERVRSLTERRANAPTVDADAIARWELDDRRGAKPKPTAETLDREIADAERDRDGLQTAVELALEEKAAYVEQHRDRLVKVAAQQTDEAHQRMRALIDELEAVRSTLVEIRQAGVWAALFPDQAAAGEPPTQLIARGLADPVTATLGLRPAPQMQAATLLELLRRDADVLKTAATPEQRAKLEGQDPNRRPTGAVWVATPDGAAAAKADKQARIDAYRETWGEDPPEWT